MTKFKIKINPTELVPKNSARLFYYGAFWLAVLQSVVIALLYRRLPVVVPLFFTEPWGEARLAPKVLLFILPSLSFLSLLINLILGRRAKETSRVLSYVLSVSTLVVVAMFSLSLAGIVQSLL